MASKGSIECLVCGGSFATDQRRKHEATLKHQNASAVVQREMIAPVKPPVPSPEVIDAHIAKLNGEIIVEEIEDKGIGGGLQVAHPGDPTNVVPFPAQAADIAAL